MAAADYPATDEPASWRPRISGISRRKALAALALALMVIVSFFPAYLAEFVWDDFVFTDEPLVKNLSGLPKIWTSPGAMRAEGHYWPVTYTTFWLEHKLWGLNPLGYHVVNVLLHLANVLLLCRLLGRLSVPGAWIVAAVFAVHPLHVESVAWVIERKDVLSGLFYLAAFLAYLRSVESRSRGPYLLALVLFVAGLLSKTVVVTLPAALMIWHWWQRGRIATKDPPAHGTVLRHRSGHRPRGYGLLPDPRGPLPGLLVDRADPDRGPGALVLRRQAAVAHRPGRHLPVVGDRSPRPPRLDIRGTRRGAAGSALARPRSLGPRSAGVRRLLRGDPVARTRPDRLRLHAVRLRRRPLSVSGGHRTADADRRNAGPGRRSAARVRHHQCEDCTCGSPGAARDSDLAACGQLPERPDSVQPHRVPESRSPRSPFKPRSRADGPGPLRGSGGGAGPGVGIESTEPHRAPEPRRCVEEARPLRRGGRTVPSCA